ncbi:ras guanine nucleotide exchange factor domain-containing protein [Coprinopsis sp. MPI-PUGE-AT-0042]|nr:ras guanine nucleotide exchange factor domain-containing protein [Coprinopsis sp. MPI-PUGE-AT-0042]
MGTSTSQLQAARSTMFKETPTHTISITHARLLDPGPRNGRGREIIERAATAWRVQWSNLLSLWTSPCQGCFPRFNSHSEFIRQLIEPHSRSEGICHGISLHLCELDNLVQFASLAYQACNSSTVIGQLVRRTIGTRLLQCKDTLGEAHRDLLRLPHRSLPLTPFICRVIYGWWSGSEPDEIAEIRLRILAEATAVAEWLCYLKLFYWAGSLLHARSSFSWKTLNQFFRSGPTWLKEIHVERIIVIEPLQGEALSIPLCFAESFEDVHRIVQSVCEGTLGSRFIEDRQYQLDESITNVTVDPTHFHAFLEDGKAFEVTMLIQTMSLATTDCPRCGCSNSSDVPSEGDDWIRCRGCRTLFNSRVSLLPSHSSQLSGLVEVSSEEDSNGHSDINEGASPLDSPQPSSGIYPSIQQEEDHPVLDDEGESTPKARLPSSDEGDAGDNGSANATIDPWTLFRRMRIEIFVLDEISDSRQSLDLVPVQEDPVHMYIGHDWRPSDLTFDVAGSVKAGTVSALVAYLTPHDHPLDQAFAEAFMKTFRSFITVDTFLDFLIARYRTQPDNVAANLSVDDSWRKQKQTVQLGVINILKLLVQVNDIREADLHISSRIENFLQSPDVIGTSPEVETLRVSITEARSRVNRLGVAKTHDIPPPAPIVPTARTREWITEIDPLELARQLTTMETRGPNDSNVFRTSDKIMVWVTDLVLSKETSRRRARTTSHLISIAHHCRLLNNFSSMTSIVAGLNTPPVRRLRWTWEQVPQQRLRMLQACQTIVDSISTFSGVRRFMASVKGPCVPFIGAYLSVVRSLQAGSLDPLSGGLINFRKQQIICEVINEVKQWQLLAFDLQRLDKVASYIGEIITQDRNTAGLNDHFWGLSLEREPRERDDEKMSRLLHESGFL